MPVRVIDSADIDENVSIGDGSSVWHLAQVHTEAVIGESCVIGRGAYVGAGVRVEQLQDPELRPVVVSIVQGGIDVSAFS